jgi:hypothetical protein
VLPYFYRITKYDPADRDEHGSYIGAAESVSDHGPIEGAYLQAVAAFAEDAGIDHLAPRNGGVSTTHPADSALGYLRLRRNNLATRSERQNQLPAPADSVTQGRS